MEKKSIAKNYVFLAIMLGSMILGALAGWLWPAQVDEAGGVISGTGATVVNTAGILCIIGLLITAILFGRCLSLASLAAVLLFVVATAASQC